MAAAATAAAAPVTQTDAATTQVTSKDTKATPPGTGGTPSTVTSGQTTPAESQGLVTRFVLFLEGIPLIGSVLKKIFTWIHLHPKEVTVAVGTAGAVVDLVVKDAAGLAIGAAGLGPVGTEVTKVTDEMVDHAIKVMEEFLIAQAGNIPADGTAPAAPTQEITTAKSADGATKPTDLKVEGKEATPQVKKVATLLHTMEKFIKIHHPHLHHKQKDKQDTPPATTTNATTAS